MFFRRLLWYALPSSLVSVQDSIMVRKIISQTEARAHLKYLLTFRHFFFSWFGFNPLAKGELAIRQLILLAIMFKISGKDALGRKCKCKAERLMSEVIKNNWHVINAAQFELAKKSFDFYAWVFGIDPYYLMLNFL